MKEIDYFDNNEHIRQKKDKLIVRLIDFPDGYSGKISQEFIETDEGKFEEFVLKDLEED